MINIPNTPSIAWIIPGLKRNGKAYINHKFEPSDIVQCVCEYLHIEMDLIFKRTRKSDVVYARQIAMFIIRTHTNMTLKSIASMFGKFDHTTVMYSVQQVANLVSLEEKTSCAFDVDNIIRNIEGKTIKDYDNRRNNHKGS